MASQRIAGLGFNRSIKVYMKSDSTYLLVVKLKKRKLSYLFTDERLQNERDDRFSIFGIAVTKTLLIPLMASVGTWKHQ